jgi:iron complex transport system permease protein
MRNPLADPFILGVSGGAATGAVLAITLGASWAFAPPTAAFLGALAATVLVYATARRSDGVHPETMLLVGVIANAFFSAIIMFLMAISDQTTLMRSNHWLMGHLSSAGLSNLSHLVPLTLFPAMYIAVKANRIHLLQLGIESAWHLGVDVNRLQRGMFLAACLLTAGAVSASGLIGFVGLITPHIIRRAFSADFRILFPLSLVGGAALVILSDTAARTLLAPSELPVGVLTAALGAPFFLFLLRRRNG